MIFARGLVTLLFFVANVKVMLLACTLQFGLVSSSSLGVWSRYSSLLLTTRSCCRLAGIYMNFTFNFIKYQNHVFHNSKPTILSIYTRE